jgi:hypothetical protein
MAVVIHQIPPAFSTSDNPLVYVFSSNQTAQPNFFYRVRTYLNGNQVGVDDVFPQVGIRAMFNASKVVKSLVPFPDISQNLIWSNDKLRSLYITVTEVYGTTPTEQASATSTTTHTWKGCVSDFNFTQGFSLYTTGTRKFLTRMPRERQKLLRGQDTGFVLITQGAGTVLQTVTAYDADNVSLGNLVANTTAGMRQFNLKASVVANALSIADPNDIKLVTIETDISETLEFEYWDGCFDAHSLLWLNDMGSFDTFIFEHNKRLSGDVEAFDYIKPFGAWSGTDFVFNLQNAGVKTVFTRQTDKGLIATDYIGQNNQNWLTETFKSPIHILYSTTDSPKPINPTARRFELEQSRFEELISLEMTYDYSNSNDGITA